MVDGQGAVDLRDLNVAHDAKAGHIQQALILFFLCFAEKKRHVSPGQRFIIALRGIPKRVILGVVQLRDSFGVAGNGAGLVEGVPVVADGGVQQQGQACKKQHDQ